MLAATQHLQASDPAALITAADLLRQGKLVIFPTDTVYGIGVNPFDPAAIERLYQAKGRPSDKGIPILLAGRQALAQVTAPLPTAMQAWLEPVLERFWPGALTLVLPRHSGLPDVISSNAGIAVRIPDHPVAQAIIRAAGGAVAASSANRSGEAPAVTAAEALTSLEGWAAAVVDGGRAPGGIPSTVLDLTGPTPRLLRAGPISDAWLLAALGQAA